MAIQTNMRMKTGDTWIIIPEVPGFPHSTTINTAEELAWYVDPKKYASSNQIDFCDQALGMVLFDIEPGEYTVEKTTIDIEVMASIISFSIDIKVKKKISMFIGLTPFGGSYTHDFTALEIGNAETNSGSIYTEYNKYGISPKDIIVENSCLSLNLKFAPDPMISIIPVGFKIIIATEKEIFQKLIDDNMENNEFFFRNYGLNGRFTMPVDLGQYEISFRVPSYLVDKPESIKVVKGGSATFDLPSVTSPGIKAIGWEYNGKIYNQGESITIENISSNITINLVIEPKQSGIVIAETSKNVVYDKDSKYPTINWGYPNGINIGVKAKTPVNALMPTKLYLVWLKDDAFIARLGKASYGVSKMLGYGGFVSGAVGNQPIEYLYRFQRYGVDRFDFLGVSERKNNADLIDHASQNSNFILHKIEEVKL